MTQTVKPIATYNSVEIGVSWYIKSNAPQKSSLNFSIDSVVQEDPPRVWPDGLP
jgi:hypothetical protein